MKSWWGWGGAGVGLGQKELKRAGGEHVRVCGTNKKAIVSLTDPPTQPKTLKSHQMPGLVVTHLETKTLD